MKKRHGIVYPLVVFLACIVAVGILWIGLYYGGILPIYNTVVATYGSGAFSTTDVDFILAVCAFWLFFCTILGLVWLWQRAQKPEGYYV